MKILVLSILVMIVNISGLSAGEVDVVNVQYVQTAADEYRFTVTLRHADTGWEHYANRWEILDPDHNLLATRKLAHPHVNEQPFTRSLSGVKIPEDIRTVEIRGHDSLHAYGGTRKVIRLEEY